MRDLFVIKVISENWLFVHLGVRQYSELEDRAAILKIFKHHSDFEQATRLLVDKKTTECSCLPKKLPPWLSYCSEEIVPKEKEQEKAVILEKRKLLAEMDKCFKKIDEGFEIFDEIMAKMSEANSDNQREKFQDDLKKEIKKLQRLRDQIKGWQNSSDIKDKENLSKFRKKIEERMETFKDIERENKTKPHSKQGLSAEDKLDPKEKEKSDAIDWLNNQIRRIQDEIDRTESKLETINTEASAGGRKRGKKDDSKKNDKEVEELKKHLERVKFHLLNLEVVMRLITNEKLEIKDVLSKLKEPVEMYIEALDPDNELESEDLDPEDIYEELNLNSYIPQLAGFNIGSVDEENKPLSENGGTRTTPTGSPPPLGTGKEAEQELKQRHQSGSDPPKPVAHTPTQPNECGKHIFIITSTRNAASTTTIPYNSVAAGITSALHQQTQQAPVVAKDQLAASVVASAAAAMPKAQQAQSITPPALTPVTPAPSSVFNSHHNSSSVEEQPAVRQILRNPERQPSVTANVLPLGSILPTPSSTIVNSNGTEAVESRQASSSTPLTTPPPGPMPVVGGFPPGIPLSYNSIAAGTAFSAASVSAGTPAAPITTNQVGAVRAEPVQLMVNNSNVGNATGAGGNASFGSNSTNNTTEDLNQQNNSNMMMRQVLRMGQNAERSTQPQTTTIPHGWVLHLLACTAQITSAHGLREAEGVLAQNAVSDTFLLPQTPPPNADSLEYYLRLNVESLFFTFYYMEGSRAQLLAAKALKKLSWRAKQITDDFEQGTYVYFDFEKWAQRKKEQFMFEYRYLEDKDFD
uniref:CCR4-NOT transcription complex subunit 3 n=1 Tax=Ditylenchus dipsaci TaxID=166011 RepID=A0A915CM52_9BILA